MNAWLWSGAGVICGALLLSACNDDSGHEGPPSPALPSGDLVPDFGVAGVVISNFGPTTGFANALAVDATWMYVGGQDNAPGLAQWRIEKRYR
jgi:hypothetical protein